MAYVGIRWKWALARSGRASAPWRGQCAQRTRAALHHAPPEPLRLGRLRRAGWRGWMACSSACDGHYGFFAKTCTYSSSWIARAQPLRWLELRTGRSQGSSWVVYCESCLLEYAFNSSAYAAMVRGGAELVFCEVICSDYAQRHAHVVALGPVWSMQSEASGSKKRARGVSGGTKFAISTTPRPGKRQRRPRPTRPLGCRALVAFATFAMHNR